jgi:pyruvate-ferredoxin/flavodoxin oxidoreductase
MVARVFSEMAQPDPKSPITVGIVDDVPHLSLADEGSITVLDDQVFQRVFFGLGSDGTVIANKNSI